MSVTFVHIVSVRSVYRAMVQSGAVGPDNGLSNRGAAKTLEYIVARGAAESFSKLGIAQQQINAGGKSLRFWSLGDDAGHAFRDQLLKTGGVRQNHRLAAGHSFGG